MSIKHLYADERPSLLLDFANSKTLDPRITFTRNSTATYVDELGVIKTAAAGEARIDHDPATGECLGLLIEESRTNLITYSEEFDNAEWVKTGLTLTANSTASPSGELTADTLTCNATQSYIYDQIFSLSTNTYYIFSVFVKKGTADYCFLSAQGHPFAYFLAVFDLSTGICTQQGTKNSTYYPLSTNYALESIPLGNDWFKLSIATNTPTYINIQFKVGFAPQGTGNVLGSDGISGAITGETMFVWGAQLETGPFPTSYIPTSGSTVTRNVDQASITGTSFSSWYNQNEGSWYVEAKCPVSPNNQWIWALNPSGTGEDMLYRGSTDALRSLARYRGDVFDTNDAPSGQFNKAVLGYNLTSQASSYFNAVSGIYSSISGNTGTPTSLAFGLTPGNSVLNGHISRLAYYNTRLSDTALEALTL